MNTPARILLGEHDAAHARLLVQAFDEMCPKPTVDVGASHEEIVRLARDGSYDCVVLDFELPPVTAVEALRDIANRIPDTPRLAISSSVDQQTVIEAMRGGFDDFINKTDALRGEELVSRVQGLIEGRIGRTAERRRERRRLEILKRQAECDPLTGLANRRFVERAMRKRDRGRDRRAWRSIFMIDIDRFKAVNDRLGHCEGDRVLKSLACVLRDCCSEADVVGRWGGEEFIVLRDSETLSEAWAWADRLRRRIPRRVVAPDPIGPITVSIGLDVMGTADMCERSVSRADHAMYLAKESGCDRVRTYDMVRAMDAAYEVGVLPCDVPTRLRTLIERVSEGLGETQLSHIGEHGAEVLRLVWLVGRAVGLDDDSMKHLILAAEFHDIGKIGIPESLLSTPRRMSADERRYVDEHARLGAEIFCACGAVGEVSEIVARHHDRYDGVNPAHRKDSRPSAVEVITACDALDAMVTSRVYAPGRTVEDAIGVIRAESGSQFHPEVVHAIEEIGAARIEALLGRRGGVAPEEKGVVTRRVIAASDAVAKTV